MRFPTIGQYIDSLTNPQGMFRSLSGVEPLCNPYGEPELSAGNFSAIFRVRMACDPGMCAYLTPDADSSHDAGPAPSGSEGAAAAEIYALKCYTRPVERIGRICEALTEVASPYPVRCRFLADELYVYDEYERGNYYPVVVAEWIEGETLGRRVARLCQADDRAELSALAERFDRMALWLLREPFAHGDIKQDNILVDRNGQLRLIDFDGMFLPEFAGERSAQLGSPAYQHPLRDERFFNRHIDDYPLALISLSLHALADEPELYALYNDKENLIFSAAEVAAGASGLFERLREQWAQAGQGALVALCRCLQSPSPRVEGLQEVLRCLLGEYALDLLPGYEVIDDDDPARALIRSGGRYGYADLTEGRIVLYPLWEEAHPFSEGVAVVRSGGVWQAVDPHGEVVARYPAYSEVAPLREGLSRVCRDGLYGFVDREGCEVIALRYPFATSFRDGRAKVRLGEDSFYIDRCGERSDVGGKNRSDNDRNPEIEQD